MEFHGFESSDDMRDDLDEGVVGRHVLVPLQPDIDWGGTRAIEVHKGLVDVFTIEIGPQIRTRREYHPPSPAYVSQHDRGLVSDVRAPEIWNESEDFGRDAVDWREAFHPPGSD